MLGAHRPIVDLSAQVRARLPWFLDALPSEQCAKGGAGGYTDALQRDAGDPSGVAGLSRGAVAASAFRTSYVPLGAQADFIGGMRVRFVDHPHRQPVLSGFGGPVSRVISFYASQHTNGT